MQSPEDLNPPPWYKQFWPWFLIALPATVVVASFFTIKLAVESDDGLVSKDYYKEGKAIHMDASAREKARELGIEAELRFDRPGNRVEVDISTRSSLALGMLQLALRHPTRADQDALLDLQPVGPSIYQAPLPELSTDSWNVELVAREAGWQLPGRINLGNASDFILR